VTDETISIHGLAEALGLPSGATGASVKGPRETVSLVGGGGKTTALFALGRQLDGSVILTTTTKMGSDRTGGYVPLLSPTAAVLEVALERERRVLVWKAIDGHRALGFSGPDCDAWRRLADHMVVEADGSRRRPFKAPAAHEPVVPSSTTLLVACVGAGAFGAPIVECCHRPDLVAGLIGCGVDDRLDPVGLARALLHAEGSLKHRPATARAVVLLNQVTGAHAGFVAELRAVIDNEVPVVAVARFDPKNSPEAPER
jgi:probable selenium-dependent hydroxylase accessory protein YqeC